MDDLMVAVIAGLVVATAGGLGTSAVKRPKGFNRLYWVVIVPIQLVNLLLLGFTIGARFAYANTGTKAQISAAMRYVQLADNAMLWMFVVTTVMVALLFLPNILGSED